jgi:hypothetical protein
MVGDTGLEHRAEMPTNPQVSETGGAESGANRPVSGPDADPDLAAVISAWPGLPQALKAGIVAMVKTAGETAAR